MFEHELPYAELRVVDLVLGWKVLAKKRTRFQVLLFFREHEQTQHYLKHFEPKVLRFEALRAA